MRILLPVVLALVLSFGLACAQPPQPTQDEEARAAETATETQADDSSSDAGAISRIGFEAGEVPEEATSTEGEAEATDVDAGDRRSSNGDQS